MSGLKVLVLEDDENLRELLCETLEDEGYRSEGAANGVEAIHKVNSGVYDLLVVDVRMEGMSGLEAFAHMRQQGVELACLVITGYATEEDSIRAIRLGVGDYLRKPFEMKELLLRLARVSAVYLRQREGLSREQRLQRQLDWLHQLHCPAEARLAGEVAAQLARGLQLDKLHQLEVQLAAALAHQGLSPAGASDWVGEGLASYQENWDGSGPQGLAEESIPLAGRIVRLALLAAAGGDNPQALVQSHPGVLDPHLLFALEFRSSQTQDKQLRRLLDLARGLLYSGQNTEATLALQQAEKLSEGPQAAEVQLLLAELEPAPLRQTRLERLLGTAPNWGPGWRSRMLTEAGLLMLEARPDQATSWLREAYGRVEQEVLRALIQLGLWALGQACDWSPLEALPVLLQPRHEPRLLRALPWLGPALLRWWLSDKREWPEFSRLLRYYAGPLVPAVVKLSPAQRLQLLELLQRQPQGVPSAWLQTLSQENDNQVRTLALQLSGKKTSSSKPPPLHLRSFGSFSVSLGGRPLNEKAFRGQRNRILLACIAASQTQAEDRVREAFWPDELEKGRKGLYNGLFHLRRALRPEGWTGDCEYFLRQQEVLGLDPDLEPWHDLWEVEKGLSRLRFLEWDEWQKQMSSIVALTEGVYLEGCYMDWALERRESLEIQLAEALFKGCARATEQESWIRLSEWSQRLLERDSANQAAALHRIRALCQLGRSEEALRTFDVVSRRVRAEFGEEPSMEMVEWAARARTWA
ncbi:MAG: response regulator [Candidatus Eremiobacteraeota bacterium]|nr:response regulator [Candidatus Eremiobacteraeota bacterium]MCW5870646.1 response regulator [Candidatus Eremiobacteraeota bacterium]